VNTSQQIHVNEFLVALKLPENESQKIHANESLVALKLPENESQSESQKIHVNESLVVLKLPENEKQKPTGKCAYHFSVDLFDAIADPPTHHAETHCLIRLGTPLSTPRFSAWSRLFVDQATQ
jgi:hypothetical protein